MMTLTLAQIRTRLGEWSSDTKVEGVEVCLRPGENEGETLRECTLFVRPNGFQVTSDQYISKPLHYAIPFDELKQVELKENTLKVHKQITYSSVPGIAMFFFLFGRLLALEFLAANMVTTMGLIWLPIGIVAGLQMVGKSIFYEKYHALSFCMKNGEELSLLVHNKQYKKASQFLQVYLPEKS